MRPLAAPMGSQARQQCGMPLARQCLPTVGRHERKGAYHRSAPVPSSELSVDGNGTVHVQLPGAG